MMLYDYEAVLPIDVALGNNPNPCLSDPLQFIHRLPTLREQVKRRLLFVRNRHANGITLHVWKISMLLVISCWFIVLYGRRVVLKNFYILFMDPSLLPNDCLLSTMLSTVRVIRRNVLIKSMCVI
jgi:hypothetical protein